MVLHRQAISVVLTCVSHPIEDQYNKQKSGKYRIYPGKTRTIPNVSGVSDYLMNVIALSGQ
jgi:hypothetical protein